MTLQNNGKRRPEGAAGSTASTPERVVARERGCNPGNGLPFIRIGRAIRYGEMALWEWLKSRQVRLAVPS